MIDLKKIEARVDSLLESETKDSLTNWLLNKRNRDLNEILGDGRFVSLQHHLSTFCSTSSVFVSGNISNESTSDSKEYLVAA